CLHHCVLPLLSEMKLEIFSTFGHFLYYSLSTNLFTSKFHIYIYIYIYLIIMQKLVESIFL
ncbi:MAG: hypothetical protein K7J15_05540, partial [Candidatus Regiella insecticola]|nr:hypothetical protein [Candidatus Regiella insecticola]